MFRLAQEYENTMNRIEHASITTHAWRVAFTKHESL
jgi:hypothetical protein